MKARALRESFEEIEKRQREGSVPSAGTPLPRRTPCPTEPCYHCVECSRHSSEPLPLPGYCGCRGWN